MLYTNAVGSSTVPAPPALTVTSYTDTSSLFDPSKRFIASTSAASYTLNQSWLGPLDPSDYTPAEVQSFFHSLVTMTLQFPPLKSFAMGSVYRSCFEWSLSVTYDFSSRGSIVASMGQEVVAYCDVYASTADGLADKANWLNVVIVLLSLIQVGLLLKSVATAVKQMMEFDSWAADQAMVAHRLTVGSSSRGSCRIGYGSGGAAANSGRSTTDGTRAETLLDNAAIAAEFISAQRQASPVPLDIHFTFDTDIDSDGPGQMFVTAAAVAPHSSRSIVFAPGWQRKLASDGSGDSLLRKSSRDRPLVWTSTSSASDFITGGGNTGLVDDEGAALALAAVGRLRREWASTALVDKALLALSGWSGVSLAACVLNITSAAMNIHGLTSSGSAATMYSHGIVTGLGAACAWVAMLRYASTSKDISSMMAALRRSTPRILRLLFGMLPIFAGYVLFALVVFSERVPRFGDLQTSIITLISAVSGSGLRDTIMAVTAHHPVTGQLFFYSFVFLHIFIAVNVVVVIAEESYAGSKALR